jgi:hypothetical protein
MPSRCRAGGEMMTSLLMWSTRSPLYKELDDSRWQMFIDMCKTDGCNVAYCFFSGC